MVKTFDDDDEDNDDVHWVDKVSDIGVGSGGYKDRELDSEIFAGLSILSLSLWI